MTSPSSEIQPPNPKRPSGEREWIIYRRRFAVEKKRDSLSVDEITDLWNAHCDELGHPEQQRRRVTISLDIRHALASIVDETKLAAVEYRELLTARIERAISAPNFLKQIENGNPLYVDRLLKAVSQLAQMHGANAPTKVAQTDTDGNDVQQGLTEDERARLVQELLAKAAERKAEAEAEQALNEE